MKTIIIAFAVASLAAITLGGRDWCDNTHFCEIDECCIAYPNRPNGEGRCRDFGDDFGDLCGGPNYCECDRGYKCVPHVIEPGQQPTHFQTISNGTCEPISPYRRPSQLHRRRYYDDDDDDDDDDDRRKR